MIDVLDLSGASLSIPVHIGAPEIIRELNEADLLALDAPREIKTPALKELKASHHQLARLLAQGMKAVEVSAITGFSQSRISILKNDPAFKELLAHYSGTVKDAFADVLETLKSMSMDALATLRDRLLETPEAFSNKELLDLVGSMLDRTGHGATAKLKAEHTHLHLGTESLSQMKQLIKESQNGLVTTTATLIENSGGPHLSLSSFQRAEDSSEPEASGGSCEGEAVREEGREVVDAMGRGAGL